ncbi:hypothetical protein QX776_02500 [Alteromonadaceae bacterium BrNp21-10]|nr:hypothetical protein [Alteromonadaceae bacterium BrNp21-10]
MRGMLPIIYTSLYILAQYIGKEGWFNYTNEPPEEWFARSGALMVLVAVMAEFHFSKRSNWHVKTAKYSPDELMARTVRLADLSKGLKKIRLTIRYFAMLICTTEHSKRELTIFWSIMHIAVVWGTFIWAYGDIYYLRVYG